MVEPVNSRSTQPSNTKTPNPEKVLKFLTEALKHPKIALFKQGHPIDAFKMKGGQAFQEVLNNQLEKLSQKDALTHLLDLYKSTPEDNQELRVFFKKELYSRLSTFKMGEVSPEEGEKLFLLANETIPRDKILESVLPYMYDQLDSGGINPHTFTARSTLTTAYEPMGDKKTESKPGKTFSKQDLQRIALNNTRGSNFSAEASYKSELESKLTLWNKAVETDSQKVPQFKKMYKDLSDLHVSYGEAYKTPGSIRDEYVEKLENTMKELKENRHNFDGIEEKSLVKVKLLNFYDTLKKFNDNDLAVQVKKAIDMFF